MAEKSPPDPVTHARVRESKGEKTREEERRNVGRGRGRTGGTPLATEIISVARGMGRASTRAREKG